MLSSIAQCFSFSKANQGLKDSETRVSAKKDVQTHSIDEQSTIQPDSIAPIDELELRRWSHSMNSMDELNEIWSNMAKIAEVRRYGGQHIRRGRRLIQHTLLPEYESQ